MAGRHSAKPEKKSKVPLIIIIAVAVAVIAGVIVLIIFLNGNSQKPTDENIETTVATSTVEETIQTAVATTTSVSDESSSSETQNSAEYHSLDETLPAETEESVDVVVPTNGGEKKAGFNATYIPYKAVDPDSGDDVPLREFFGTSYADGVITFNSDGTFRDGLISSSANSGAYIVEDNTINATYTNDKNITITINSWEDDAPSAFTVHYNGCDVYFHD